MILIHLMQDMPTLVANLNSSGDIGTGFLLWHFQIDWSLLAQGTTYNTDVFATARSSFDHFVQSGQVWALLIGLVIGYLFRSFTTYG